MLGGLVGGWVDGWVGEWVFVCRVSLETLYTSLFALNRSHVYHSMPCTMHRALRHTRRGVSLAFLRLVVQLWGEFADNCELLIAGTEEDGLPANG